MIGVKHKIILRYRVVKMHFLLICLFVFSKVFAANCVTIDGDCCSEPRHSSIADSIRVSGFVHGEIFNLETIGKTSANICLSLENGKCTLQKGVSLDLKSNKALVHGYSSEAGYRSCRIKAYKCNAPDSTIKYITISVNVVDSLIEATK